MNSIEADMRLIRDLLVARREQLTATLEQPATKARDDQVRILRDSIDIIWIRSTEGSSNQFSHYKPPCIELNIISDENIIL